MGQHRHSKAPCLSEVGDQAEDGRHSRRDAFWMTNTQCRSWQHLCEMRCLEVVAESRRNHGAQQELMARVSKGQSKVKGQRKGKGRSHMVTYSWLCLKIHSFIHWLPQQVYIGHQVCAKYCPTLYGWGAQQGHQESCNPLCPHQTHDLMEARQTVSE